MKALKNRCQEGLSLVELMISMVIGLLIMGGVISIFSSTSAASRSSGNLSQIQETARTVFSLLSRDLREAGLNDCGHTQRVVNLIKDSASTPWASWNGGLVGYDAAMPGVTTGEGVGDRVAGTDALMVMRGGEARSTVVSHDPAAAKFLVSAAPSIASGDPVIVCDYTQGSIFQVSNVIAAPPTIMHETGGAAVPGNCSQGLGWRNPPDCSTLGTEKLYGQNSTIMPLISAGWYLGHNGRGSSEMNSLFRIVPINAAGTISIARQELFDGIGDLQLTYLVRGASDYRDANLIATTDWTNVVSVKIVLRLVGDDQERDAEGKLTRISRSFTHVVALRNRTT